jgi:hypothetical protein
MIRLGIPDKPKKCIGKNVQFTPTKKAKKCNLDKNWLYINPSNFVIQ